MIRTQTLNDRPELLDALNRLYSEVWSLPLVPSITNDLIPRMTTDFADCIVVATEESGTDVVAYGTALPFVGPDDIEDLPDEGYDAVMRSAVQTRDAKGRPNMISAVAIGVAAHCQGQGVSTLMAEALCKLARKHGFDDLVIPIRPTLKAKEPLVGMEEYAHRVREDGLPYDPWTRVHVRLGARIVKVCPRSQTRKGSVADWEGVTGMTFSKSGEYSVPSGLAPLRVDLEKDEAILIEPNVWVHYRLR